MRWQRRRFTRPFFFRCSAPSGCRLPHGPTRRTDHSHHPSVGGPSRTSAGVNFWETLLHQQFRQETGPTLARTAPDEAGIVVTIRRFDAPKVRLDAAENRPPITARKGDGWLGLQGRRSSDHGTRLPLARRLRLHRPALAASLSAH